MNRTAINKRANKEIARIVRDKNINFCQIHLPGCNGLFLAAAHRHDRRWYYDKPDELLWDESQWMLGCQYCHTKIDHDKELREKIFLREGGEGK